jgi:signal transduction histidine kinase
MTLLTAPRHITPATPEPGRGRPDGPVTVKPQVTPGTPQELRSAAGQRTRAVRYLLAIGVVVAVTALRIPLAPLLGTSVPFILYFPAVVIAGWYGGFGPGFVATLLSGYCAKTWFFEPYGTFVIENWGSAFRLLVFLVSGTLASYLCGRLHERTEQLQREKARLEDTVRERTTHLQGALSDMEAFSYTVSHDLRSPMRTMHGFSEILLEQYSDVLDAEGRGYLERIRKAATRLDHLINDLLAFAKVSGANIELRPVPLRAAVEHVVEGSSRWSSGEVELSFEGCVHTVRANETLLNQIVQNLMENAAKFVPPGVKPAVRVWSEERGEVVRLWVADNGIGIAPEHQARLFRMFERIETKSYGGTGIGLAIVDRAVLKMNGHVGVESQPGQGSRFWVELAKA